MDEVEGWQCRGWLCKHGYADEVGDVFTESTDFHLEDGAKLGVYFEHGQDDALSKKRIGIGEVERRPEGLWIQADIFLAGGFGKALRRLSRDRLLGWSSGAVPGLVERKRIGPSLNHLVSWCPGEASLTMTPCMRLPHSSVLMKRLNLGESKLNVEELLLMQRVDAEHERFERVQAKTLAIERRSDCEQKAIEERARHELWNYYRLLSRLTDR
jgi:hypothetical protein